MEWGDGGDVGLHNTPVDSTTIFVDCLHLLHVVACFYYVSLFFAFLLTHDINTVINYMNRLFMFLLCIIFLGIHLSVNEYFLSVS